MNHVRIVNLRIQPLRRARFLSEVSIPFLIFLAAGTAVWVSGNPQHVAVAGLAIALVAALISYFTQGTVSLRSKISESENLAVNGALELLEEAVQKLSHSVEQGRRSRIDWLTAARNIRITKQLVEQVQDPARKALALERELLYRQRIRNILSPLETGDLDGLPECFFADSPSDYLSFICSKGKLDPIAESALVEIYRFAQWPDGVKDVLEDDLEFSEPEIDRMVSFGPRCLGRLMAEAHRLRGMRPDLKPGQRPEDFHDED
jgi:hypothetical protein